MFREPCLIPWYRETVALHSKLSVVISTACKRGISAYASILSNFSLSSRQRGIQMQLKILTAYSEKNLGHAELAVVCSVKCESPINRTKIQRRQHGGMKPKNFSGVFKTV